MKSWHNRSEDINLISHCYVSQNQQSSTTMLDQADGVTWPLLEPRRAGHLAKAAAQDNLLLCSV